MIVSRKTTDQYNILNNITGFPDCMMSISQLLSLRQNANAVVLYPLIVNEIVRYEFTPLIISQNTSNIYLLNNNASGSLPTNFYDGTIAYSDAMTPTDSSMFCYNTHLNRFEERGISIASFIRNNIGYRYYNLSDTSGLEGVIYIPDWIEDIYINDELLLNWENITIRLNHNITQATILDMNAATDNQECSYNTNTLFTTGTDFRDFAISGTEYNQDMIFADDELMLYKKYESYIQCYSYYHSPTDNGGGWKIYYQGEAIGGYTGGIFGKYDKYFGVAFLVDEEHEYGQIIECYSYYPNTSWNQKHYTKRLITNSNMLHKAYLLIKEILTGATVKVSYYLPDDNYTYTKLTYNSEHEPEDKDDGTSIDILPSNTSVNVEGLEEDTLYYFTIFTNKSESEPFPFIVGEVPGPTPPPVEATYFINYYKYILPSNFPNWAWFDTNSYYFFSRACSTDTSWNSNDFIICNGGALYFTWDDNNNHWNIDYTGEIISSSESILYSAMYNEGWSGPYTITSSFSTYTIENWWNNFVYSNLNQITNDLVDILNFAARICRNVPVYVNGIQYSN